MQLPESLQQDVIAAVKKSLTFDVLYQRIRPDISPFVAATSKLPLKSLDDWERLIRHTIDVSLQSSVAKRPRFMHFPVASLRWLDICHADGFRRERALKSLSGNAPNRFLFALVVRKLNDWVPQVRKAASDVLPLLAETTDPDIVVDVLFTTLSYWNSWGRMGEAEKAILLNIISIEKIAVLLKKRLMFSTSGPSATVFMQAGRTAVLDHALREIAELSIQPTLRAKAYRCLLEGKFVWAEGTTWQWIDKSYGIKRKIPLLKQRAIAPTLPFPQCLTLAAQDRSPMVRRIAGELLIKELEQLGNDAITLATALASDTSPSVAERGRFALAESGKRQ